MATINHVFTSPQADDPDATLVRPTDWNSVHAFTLQDAVSLSGNTAGVLAGISSGTLYLAGGNNITLSQNGNSVTLSAFNQTEQTQSRFNLTLSGNTAGAMALIQSGVMTFAGGNNITLSQAGNAVTISAANETQTVAPIGTAVKGVSSVGSTGTVTRFAPEDHQHAGLHSINVAGNTVGATTAGAGSFLLAGGNNITLSGATAAGGMSLTISGGAGAGVIGTSVEPVASVSSVGTVTRYAPEDHRHAGLHSLNVGGNTAGATSAGAGSFMLAGGDNITLSGATDAGGMTLSVVAGAGAGGGFSAGVSTGGNTVGTTGTVASRVVFVGGSNITLSQSVNGASATVTINHTAPAAALYALPTDFISTTRDFAASMSTIFLVPLVVPCQMTMNRVAMLNSGNFATQSSGVSNTTYGLTISRGVALYSYNGQSLALHASSSATPTVSWTSNISTVSLHSVRLHTLPLAATLAPGNWWVAFSFSSSAIRTASNSSVATTLANSYYIGANPTMAAVAGIWSQASDTANRMAQFAGVYSAQSDEFPASIGSGDVVTAGSVNLWFRLDGAITG